MKSIRVKTKVPLTFHSDASDSHTISKLATQCGWIKTTQREDAFAAKLDGNHRTGLQTASFSIVTTKSILINAGDKTFLERCISALSHVAYSRKQRPCCRVAARQVLARYHHQFTIHKFPSTSSHPSWAAPHKDPFPATLPRSTHYWAMSSRDKFLCGRRVVVPSSTSKHHTSSSRN